MWSCIVFVQAAESVRRFLDPTYTDYGFSHTYYDRVPCAAVVRRHWLDRLAGHIDTRTAVDRILAEVFER